MMARNSFIFLWLVSTFLGCSDCGEGFTVTELIHLSEMNADDFESHVMSKGYALQTDRDRDRYYYSKKSEGNKGEPHDDVVSWEQNKGERIVSYQSCDEEYYTEIKHEIKRLGFIFADPNTSLETMEGNLSYVKGETSLNLITIPKSNENDLKASLYRIEIKQPIDKPRIQ